MLLMCKDVKKAFGHAIILENVSFVMEEKEKVAVVGVNGAGKTTLLKMIAGQEELDFGEIILTKNAKLGYLSQISDLKGHRTTEEEFNSLSHKLEETWGYEYESRLRGMLNGLGFDATQSIQSLSGGQKTKVALAKLLLQEPNLLLLDEPTNHLDMDAIRWLEGFLLSYPKAVLMVSHDRYFMDKTASKIIEISGGKSAVYTGNYSNYVQKRDENHAILERHYASQQKEIKRQEEVIKQLRSFNREKSIKRAESREKMLNKLDRTEKPDAPPEKMGLILQPSKESGQDVLQVKDVAKSFGAGNIFEGISFDIQKGEKIALIGPNGVGKTTLFRMIMGEMQGSGTIQIGSGVMRGYYDQEHQNINPQLSAYQEILDANPKMTTTAIRNALAAFGFKGDDVFKLISTLSGGERGRVALAKMMLATSNFLLLDEPTNHLDIYSKEVLEEALCHYTGTVLYISHDRYFMNRTAQKIIELTPTAAVVYWGNYDYYMEKKQDTALPVPETTQPPPEESAAKINWQKRKEDQAEQRRLKNLLEKTEKEIAKAEERIKQLDELLLTQEVSTNPILANDTYQQKVELEEELLKLYEVWEKNTLL